ncbi:MAG: TatD family hydrolase [Oligoflexales bacterium]
MYADVHVHLTHEKFSSDLPEIISECVAAGFGALVVNGLNPTSNRQVLAMAQKYPVVKPALGIYPIDAINELNPQLPFPIENFKVADEIAFIKKCAEDRSIIAVGECGLDGYWVQSETFATQEKVFEQLIEIAKTNNLPLIIHTRKLEKRAIELLEHAQVKKVDFHCFGGKVNLALQAAEKHGWHFSIPANARRNEAFTKMLKNLPMASILTETDAPFLPPQPGGRNVPSNVIDTVAYLAELRKIDKNEAKNHVWNNYLQLFEKDAVYAPAKVP